MAPDRASCPPTRCGAVQRGRASVALPCEGFVPSGIHQEGVVLGAVVHLGGRRRARCTQGCRPLREFVSYPRLAHDE